MATGAVIGSKATVSYWDLLASPVGWTQYVEVREFGDVAETKSEEDVTTTDSDAVERIGGLKDGDKFGMKQNFTATSYGVAKDQFDADETLDLKVDFTPTGVAVTKYFKFVSLKCAIEKVDPKKAVTIMFEGRITNGVSDTTTVGV